MPKYQWEPTAGVSGRDRDTETGRFIKSASVRAELDRYLDNSDPAKALAEALRGSRPGRVAGWQSVTRSEAVRGAAALGFQGFFMMVCVAIYTVLVQSIVLSENIHASIFQIAAYTVLLCFSLFKTGSLSKSIFNAH